MKCSHLVPGKNLVLSFSISAKSRSPHNFRSNLSAEVLSMSIANWSHALDFQFWALPTRIPSQQNWKRLLWGTRSTNTVFSFASSYIFLFHLCLPVLQLDQRSSNLNDSCIKNNNRRKQLASLATKSNVPSRASNTFFFQRNFSASPPHHVKIQ